MLLSYQLRSRSYALVGRLLKQLGGEHTYTPCMMAQWTVCTVGTWNANSWH